MQSFGFTGPGIPNRMAGLFQPLERRRLCPQRSNVIGAFGKIGRCCVRTCIRFISGMVIVSKREIDLESVLAGTAITIKTLSNGHLVVVGLAFT
jgi:hypothetical protein